MSFGALDYLVVVLFVGAILALGFSVKLKSNTTLQFLAAGRQLTLPLFVASLVSMWYGDVLGVGDSVSAFGVGTWVLFGVPYYAFAIIYAFTMSRRVRKEAQLSIPERLELRFGKSTAIAGAVLLFLLAAPTAHVLMLGTLVQALTGGQLWLCVLAGAAVGASFLFRGGLLADARVSLLAFAMMYLGFLVMAIWCLTHYPLLPTLNSIPNKDLLKWDGGTGWVYVLSLFILGAWTFVDPGFHQRVTSGATPQIAKRGVLISTAFWVIFDLLSTTVGLYAVALNPKVSGLQVFPSFAQQILPPGLKALFFCGMLGAIVSAMVAYSLVSGATIGREIVARLRPGMTDERVTLWTRIGIFIACAAAITLALNIRDVVVDLWSNWSGAVVGAMLLPFLMAYRKRPLKIGAFAMTASIVVSFTGAVVWMFYGKAHGNEYLELVFLRTQEGVRIVMPYGPASQALLSSGTKMAIGTLLPGLLVSLAIIASGMALANVRKDA